MTTLFWLAAAAGLVLSGWIAREVFSAVVNALVHRDLDRWGQP